MFSFKKIQHCKHLKKKPHTLESNLDKKKRNVSMSEEEKIYNYLKG